ncbi:hypothetical protein [Veillonella magna]|uniref:Uncharacterized protein n=1 Tax=Veillonella magna TaxID=464322 RepID=A0ABS2GGE8_9FIRM|nr:hypothetical protein [Veillonella magna]MBM6824795.1 hypothetical protein [Veillonella magna]MBM6913126.1 hypothetical protein [Veillonella magna]
MTVLDEKTQAMRDRIDPWREQVGPLDWQLRADTPQEIRDLEKEYQKRLFEIKFGLDYSFNKI